MAFHCGAGPGTGAEAIVTGAARDGHAAIRVFACSDGADVAPSGRASVAALGGDASEVAFGFPARRSALCSSPRAASAALAASACNAEAGSELNATNAPGEAMGAGAMEAGGGDMSRSRTKGGRVSVLSAGRMLTRESAFESGSQSEGSTHGACANARERAGSNAQNENLAKMLRRDSVRDAGSQPSLRESCARCGQRANFKNVKRATSHQARHASSRKSEISATIAPSYWLQLFQGGKSVARFFG